MSRKSKYAPVVKLEPPAPHIRTLPRKEIKNPSQISNAKVEAFLMTYEKTMDFSDACRISGIPLRTMRALIAQQPEIVARIEEIEHSRLDALEKLVFEDALEDAESRRWVLARLRKDRWGSGGKGGGTTFNAMIQINNTTTPRELTEEELLKIATGGRTPVEAEKGE